MVIDAPDGSILEVRVIPRAGKTSLAGMREGALLVRLAAAPVAGAANRALIALLSERLQIPTQRITIISGGKARTKRVKVIGVSAAALRERLEASERNGR